MSSSSQRGEGGAPSVATGSQSESSADSSGDSQGDSAQSETAAGEQSGSSAANRDGTSPGQDAGTQSRYPEGQADGNGGRDTSTGDLGDANSGDQGASGGTLSRPGGDYSLDTLPSGVLSGNSSNQTTGTLTQAERAAVLDERLRRGYETFDGFILSERERAQAESNAAGSVAIGGAGGGGGDAGQPQTLPEAGAPSGVPVAGQPSVSCPSQRTETFPPPEDIPSGLDDDVVARQLREAAMNEPDPVLREALWDEYRSYTGLGEQQ